MTCYIFARWNDYWNSYDISFEINKKSLVGVEDWKLVSAVSSVSDVERVLYDLDFDGEYIDYFIESIPSYIIIDWTRNEV